MAVDHDSPLCRGDGIFVSFDENNVSYSEYSSFLSLLLRCPLKSALCVHLCCLTGGSVPSYIPRKRDLAAAQESHLVKDLHALAAPAPLFIPCCHLPLFADEMLLHPRSLNATKFSTCRDPPPTANDEISRNNPSSFSPL